MKELKAKVSEILLGKINTIGVDVAIEISDQIDEAIDNAQPMTVEFMIKGTELVGILRKRPNQ